MPEISAIQEQIEEDDGVPGARARKNAQRAKDANPVKTPVPVDGEEAYVDQFSLFRRLLSDNE